MKDSKVSGIVLLNKSPGMTSFSAIGRVKRILGTKKVGHTGTLDSFAQGLLVVCVGSLTRLASRITAFDKEYIALIHFGSQTDTLDPTGAVIKTAMRPALDVLKKSLEKFKGHLMQRPPEFSAIKIGGRRASDLTRSGKAAEIPERPVTVFENELLDVAFDKEGRVEFARVRFVVSKGTYIRSLARDIGLDCNTVAHLKELFRTRVGNFSVNDAVCLDENRRASVLKEILHPMTPALSVECGFVPIILLEKNEDDFYNGRPIRASWFEKSLSDGGGQENLSLAVFTKEGVFAGVAVTDGQRFKYEYVVPRGAL